MSYRQVCILGERLMHYVNLDNVQIRVATTSCRFQHYVNFPVMKVASLNCNRLGYMELVLREK